VANYLVFRYTNWRDEEHQYIVEPEGIGVGISQYDHGELVLHAHVIARDGDPRIELLTRRRTFIVNKIHDLQEIKTYNEAR
jgi:hypothetical protein